MELDPKPDENLIANIPTPPRSSPSADTPGSLPGFCIMFLLSVMDQLLQKLMMCFVFLMTFCSEGSLSHGACGF